MSEEDSFDDVYDEGIGDDDYGFIVDSNGELKSVWYPEHLYAEPPKNIIRILKIFGYKTLEELDPPTTRH